jgi:hypothetical protein
MYRLPLFGRLKKKMLTWLRRFYFVDEREQDGTPMWNGVNADVHAEFIAGTADGSVRDVPWKATIVKGKGYVPFTDDAPK